MGRTLSQTTPDGSQTSFSYDDTANTITKTYPNGLMEKYCYDAIGRYDKTQRKGSQQASWDEMESYVYDNFSNILEYTYKTGDNATAKEVYGYYPDGLPMTKEIQAGGASYNKMAYAYSYDRANNGSVIFTKVYNTPTTYASLYQYYDEVWQCG